MLASVTAPSPGAAAPTYIQTHSDRIPDFGASPSIASVANGAWSSAATWSGNRLPVAGDVVKIAAGTTVTYDLANSPELEAVAIEDGGTLRFRTDVTTQLLVENLLVREGGTLEIGTATVPVAPGVTATVMIANRAPDPAVDPEQYGAGFIALGRVRMHGHAKTPTFSRLAAEPRAGDTTLVLAEAVSGWQAGDRLYVPDSRQLQWNERDENYSPRWETVTLSGVSGDGRTLTLAAPLAHDHRGSRVLPGDAPEFLPHVANLSRNVSIRSQNILETRGYTLFTERADVDVRYVRFAGLGRTTNDPFDDTTFDGSGNVTRAGTNQRGRYPVYLRHLIGPPVPQANGHQFTFVGNAIVCPLDPMPFRWGLVVGDSHYGLLRENVINNWAGAGFVTESGSETHNVIERNFVARTSGTGERIDREGRAGSSFWFRGPDNVVRDNVATNARGGVYTYGFNYFAEYLGTAVLPVGRGADPATPAGGVATDMHAVALREFRDNEAYGAIDNGLTLWWIGTFSEMPRDAVGESIVANFRVWNHHRWGYFGYDTNRVTIDGFVARGAHLGGTIGLKDGADYYTRNHIVQNADIRGMDLGIELPGRTVEADHPATIRDSFLDNNVNLSFQSLWTNAYRGDTIPPRTIILQNVRYGRRAAQAVSTPWDITTVFLGASMSGGIKNWVLPDRLIVYDHDGVAGDDFEVFYVEQDPLFVVPQTTWNEDGTPGHVGCPVANLTNQQCWDQYATAIGGAVAPCRDVSSRPSIAGYTCAITDAPPPPPAQTPPPTSGPSPTPTPTPGGSGGGGSTGGGSGGSSDGSSSRGGAGELAGDGTTIDFDADGVTDFAVFRPADGRWFADTDHDGMSDLNVRYGSPGDVAVPGDYDGDGFTDLAVFRPLTGEWFADTTLDGASDLRRRFGAPGDVPVPGDYDGDGKLDLAVFRPSDGTWYVDTNRDGRSDLRVRYGSRGDVPVPGDYDGDGRTDLAVFRPSDGRWYVDTNRDGRSDVGARYGEAGDVPVAGDYDGDGRSDFAIFRPSSGTWYVDSNRDGGSDRRVRYGSRGDVAVPGDYDGDGTTDPAVFRPSEGVWYVDTNGDGRSDARIRYGKEADVPLRREGWVLDLLGVPRF